MTGLVVINRGIAAAADLWDQDLDTTSTPDGVYDLRTGDRVELDREAFSTMKTAEESAPIGTAPLRLLEFLDRIWTAIGRRSISFRSGAA